MAWKDVKVQRKFAIGFGSIILMLIGSSLVSILLIQQIVKDAGQVIGGNKLKSEIIQKEVDHLNWQGALSLYVNDNRGTIESVETNPDNCRFGQWLNSQERQDAELLVPTLTPILTSLETYHDDLHNSVLKIEQTHRIVDPEMGNYLRERKLDHISWKLNLLDYITDDRMTENPVQMDPEKCALGIWHASDAVRKLSTENSHISSIISRLVSSHEAVHKGASVIEQYLQEGEKEEALSYFHEDLEEDMTATLNYLNQLIDWHDSEMIKQNRSREIFATETHSALVQVQDHFHQMVDTVSSSILTEDAMLDAAEAGSRTLLISSLIIVIVAIVTAVILTLSLLRPIIKCVVFADQVATGDLKASLDIDQKDQIGELAESLRRVLQGFRDKAMVVEHFAEGDLTAEVTTLSDQDGLGLSLRKMKKDLNELIGQVVAAVDQISSGAEQIAQASQSLSEGAATQASSTEEVSVMVNQISGQAAQNADNASQAKSISEKATMDAEKGNESMTGVVSLMEKINSGADETKKIVKVIDDIAFQINLLALNANVEAARAGKYGKGFAVVADEVRNLAVKSAQAARETSDMVEESIGNIQNGYAAVQKSAEQLREIVEGSRRVSEILEEIAAASRNQDDGISQATGGLDQIDKITQENTGNAEETASASEELSSQSLQLKGLVDRFKLEKDEHAKALPGRPAGRTGYKKAFLERKPSDSSLKSGEKTGFNKPASNKEEKLSEEKRFFTKPPEGSFSTGIKPVNPSEVISLDDNDFDQF
ncbi:methyl-accepting chemotaxis protein [Spirochaeta isovalerica]|uniref:Methyl-accepting chemotaxis protein n=1 Tax=Spirochaeta isovalerica TaxID=150 RepID=A0A841RG03_9SPIO|nr:methyl-accepting chemotaxis protein [Spirochaeta isovalerica]MBB6481930.1 methyl-accepting chemotaxis protein [Spirochaeta isovalerica]